MARTVHGVELNANVVKVLYEAMAKEPLVHQWLALNQALQDELHLPMLRIGEALELRFHVINEAFALGLAPAPATSL